MTRKMGMVLAAWALAACSGQEPAADAGAADAMPDSAPVQRTAPGAATPAPAPAGAGETIRIHPDVPAHAVALHGGEPGVVDSIVVTADGRHVQTLRPAENLVPAEAGVQRLSTIDLDYDGYADLALLNSVAMANSRSEYWRYDPSARRFTPVGEMETLTPDPAAREHTAFNRGGHGGRLWTAWRHRWVNGRLMTIAEEEQALHEDGERYVHIVRRHQDGRMAESVRDTMKGDDELRAGPSWMKP